MPNQLPIIGLSPMDGVTDHPFRHMVAQHSRPDIMFTEFTSAEGLSRNANRLFRDLLFDASQRPIVAQIFGKEPRAFFVASMIVSALGFNGLDINMGCPAKNVRQSGSGAALINTPQLAQELIRQAKAGTQAWVNGLELNDLPELNDHTRHLISAWRAQLPAVDQERRKLPISVKTRIGYSHNVVSEWIPYLLEMQPDMITVHGRTLQQLYGGQADWAAIAAAAQLCHEAGVKILGNGDVQSPAQAWDRYQQSGVDGLLIGRATFGEPWLIGEMKRYCQAQQQGPSYTPSTVSIAQRCQAALDHAQLFTATFPGADFLPMRKHLAWYVKGMEGAAQLRTQLVRTNSAAEVAAILAPWLPQ